ncbi:hypothetical protein [Mammaliicoccus vitulinus]|uniref:hypothetical protein n=1 Tax=Mammaliicoccus vitulinus TaxID=71237 RepID=UPI00248CDBB3|nr:hypothetical protein [Mammaliicoccus vitulinus]
MEKTVIYITFDNINGEKIEHYCFDDLKDYLNIFKNRLNIENEQLNEMKNYKLHTLVDVFEICEVANIDIKIPILSEV